MSSVLHIYLIRKVAVFIIAIFFVIGLGGRMGMFDKNEELYLIEEKFS